MTAIKIDDLILELKNQGFKVWAIEQTENSKTLSEMEMIEINTKHVLIFGNELNGVKQDVVNNCDDVIEINQYGTKHSLNVSIAVGIVIWNFFKLLNKEI